MIRAGLAMFLAAGPAWASPQCVDRTQMVSILAEKYGKQPVAMGVAADQTLMELYAGDKGTWTLTVTLGTGLSCLVAAGSGFEALLSKPRPEGEPG